MALRFRMLGPVRVRVGGGWVPIAAAQQRVVLAVLLAAAGRAVSTERLVDAVWGERPPRRAVNTVQVYVAKLRRLLGDGALATQDRGYALVCSDGDIDAGVFEGLAASGRRELQRGRHGAGTARLAKALALWRGPVFADLPSNPALELCVANLEQLRLATEEDHAAALLECGQHETVVDQLRRMADDHPLRERRWVLLMTALHRCGRRAEALDAYQRERQHLHDELGVEPGRQLREAQRAVLTDDASPGPALAPPALVPAQLPADVASFTGRGDHLRRLDALLNGGPTPSAVLISAIAGTAGVGKTALALHWAHRVSARFPDGQLYVNLRGYGAGPPVRPIDALARFLSALGAPADQVPADVEDAAALYRSWLANKRMLIMLDNASHADQVRPLLPGTPGCLVTVTSRDRLSGLVARDGAVRMSLDVLTPAESEALLAGLLGPDRVRAEPAAAARLARLCGHLPLALRIVAANLIAYPHRTLAAHAAELAGADRLTSLELPDDPQAAVRVAFDESYARLPPDVRRLFRRLGLLPGVDVTEAAASALSDASQEVTARLLNRLADAHLVDESAPGRYAMHDLIRFYAAERAAAEDDRVDREAALQRLHQHYLSTVDSAATLLYPQVVRLPVPRDGSVRPGLAFDDHAQALAWLDAERPNLLAAIHHAATHGPFTAAWRLADALRGHLYLRMHTVDWHAAATAALDAAEADRDLHGQAAARLSLAALHGVQNRYRQAIGEFESALERARQVGWVAGQAAMLGNLGAMHDELGQLDRAVDGYTEALALDRRTGRLAGQATTLGNLGLVALRLGRLDDALAHFTEALALHRRVGSRTGEARTMTNLGETYHALGRLAEAEDTLTEALALQRAAGSRNVEPDTLRSLAAVLRDAGRYVDALACVQDGLTLARDIGDRRIEAEALAVQASVRLRLGDEDAAADEYRQALDLARKIGNRYTEADTLIGLAEVHLRAGRLDQASEHADAALAIAADVGYQVVADRAKVLRLAARGIDASVCRRPDDLSHNDRTGQANLNPQVKGFAI